MPIRRREGEGVGIRSTWFSTPGVTGRGCEHLYNGSVGATEARKVLVVNVKVVSPLPDSRPCIHAVEVLQERVATDVGRGAYGNGRAR